jgi:RHS repeat-associated protein
VKTWPEPRRSVFADSARLVGGRLTSVTQYLDTTPLVTSYGYDELGNRIRQIDANQHTTTYAYDQLGRRIGRTLPLQMNLLSVTSPAPDANTSASVTTFGCDAKGQLTSITGPLPNQSTAIAYTPEGLIQSITDAQNNLTSYEYDARGNLTKVIDAINGAAHPTTFEYDIMDRLTKITYPDGTHVDFGYDYRGRRTSVTDQNERPTTYAYDDADRLISVTDAASNVTQYGYNTEDNLTSITDANNHTTSFQYDGFGRVTQTTFPSTKVETYGYDAVGNLTSKQDRKGQLITYVYDDLNRLTHKSYPDSTGVDYVYDLVGKLKQVSDPTGTYGFAYDNMGRLIGTTTQYSFLPGVTLTNGYSYDKASNRPGYTAPDGSTVTYNYDSLNRLSTLTSSWAGPFGFSYDGLSRRTQLTRPNGINTNYGYDSVSRLLSVLHQAGAVTVDGAGYTMDNAGNRTSELNLQTGMTESYSYDLIYQLTQVTQGASTTESYTYDNVGNLAGYTYPNGVTTSYTYDNLNRLTNLSSAAVLGGGPSVLAQYTYVLGKAGNRLSVTELSGRTVQYGYDDLYRLTSETIAVATGGTFTCGSNSERCGTVGYIYDAVGNRQQRTSTLPAIPATGLLYYDANDRTNTDGYDNNGNTVTSAGIVNAYDFENHLIKHGEVTVVYDGDGNRVAETTGAGTTQYLVDTENPTGYAQVIEELQSGKVTRTYTWGLSLIAQNLRTGPEDGPVWQLSYYGFDGHGSVRYLTDPSGAITDTYDYDAFGNLINQTGTTPNNYLFAGEQCDPALGLYYNRARYLDVRTGRFWGMDEYEGDLQSPTSLHRYLHGSADPVDRTDPSGNNDLVEVAAYTGTQAILRSMAIMSVKGAIFGGLFGGVDAALQGKSGKEILYAAAQGGLVGAVLGPLAKIRFVAPVLVAFGSSTGVAGTVEAIEKGNWALAVFRAGMVLIGFRTFVEEPVGSGGRWGGENTRFQLHVYAKFLESKGWKIVNGGGGLMPEEYLPGSGPGTNGSNYVDLTATKNGVVLRINTVTTKSDGITPTLEEAAAAALIRSKIPPNDVLMLLPKWCLPDWYLPTVPR